MANPIAMTVRVFVSHSAKEADAKKVQRALRAALESNARFTLLMDQYTLAPGDAWRAQINLWLGACDTAVVLLSPAALESPYVLYELSVLSYRASTSGGRFRILPVYVGAVDEQLLRRSRLDPMQLTEIQALRGTPEEIAAGVMAELARCRAAEERPIDRLLERFRDLLENVSERVLKRAAGKLRLATPWQPDADPVGHFAARLLSVGMEAAIPALIELRQVLRAEEMRKLVELVACSWIDFKAVEELPRLATAPAGRAVALNGRKSKLIDMYALAASGGRDTWRFVDATNVCPDPEGEETFGDALAVRIGEVLRRQLRLRGDEDLQATLNRNTHNVVLVGMRWEGLDEEVLERLESVYPHVTFFFLTGEAAGDIPVDERLLRLIVPQLQHGEESSVLDQYDSLHINVMLPIR